MMDLERSMGSIVPTVLTANALVVARTLDGYGLDSRAILKQAGLDPAKLFDENARYSFPAMTKLWQLAGEASADPCFGLRVIDYWHPSNLHALGFAWLASSTLKEAIQRAERYVRIVNSAATMSLGETTEGYELMTFSVPNEFSPQPALYSIDAGMALILHLCRISAGKDLMPLRMQVKRPLPDCAERYYNYFGPNILFNSEQNIFIFDKHNIEKQLPTANIELALSCDKIIKGYLAKMDKSDIVMQVKTKLTDTLTSGSVSEKHIAESLNMSLRSLQRRLEEKGYNYKQILEETRRELAEQYIRNSRLSVSEITYMLGFSEPSNFSRAFKRWTGKSPQDYRNAA